MEDHDRCKDLEKRLVESKDRIVSLQSTEDKECVHDVQKELSILSEILAEFRVAFEVWFDTLESDSHASRSPSLHEILERQTQLTELLALQHLQSLLPPIALTKFNGDPTKYSTFLGGFESEIEKRTVSNEARLRYLDQYLEGEPKELIKGCMYKDANVGYPEAKSLLKEKYGDKYKISQEYMKIY